MIAKRLLGYQRRLLHEWRMLRYKYDAYRARCYYSSFINHLKRKPANVLLGPNSAEFGGVKNHIEAIERFSRQNAMLMPPREYRTRLTPYHFTNTFHNHFSSFIPHGTRIVHSHVFPWFMNWCHHCSQNGLTWLHTYHLNYFPEHAQGSLAPWQLEINEAATTVARHATVRLSVSKWQVDYFKSRYKIDSIYIPNGVDVTICDRANPKRFVRQTGLSNFVLYVGRNDPVKNPLEFVKLAQANPKRDFVMIGGGLSSELVQQKYQLKPANLKVLGSLSLQSIQDAIAASDAVVVTSFREGLPTLVMEAMTAKKPIVVPNEAGCSEAIGFGEAGFIYSLGDIEDLSRKLEQALLNRRIAENGRDRVLREYDWRVVAPQLDNLYSQFL
jgi:glycosyltransferase involved in cell wall biosynthesis